MKTNLTLNNVELTPYQVGKMFADSNSIEQGLALNIIATEFANWGSAKECMQVMDLVDNLTEEACDWIAMLHRNCEDRK